MNVFHRIWFRLRQLVAGGVAVSEATADRGDTSGSDLGEHGEYDGRAGAETGGGWRF